MNYKESTVALVEKLDDFDNEYVYDIGVNDTDPYFFANDVLVHNSVYFSAYPVVKNDVENKNIPWTKESVVQLYDMVCDEANRSFTQFMKDAFHCPSERSGVIKAGREIVGTSGLFITKKRYAIMVYDEENTRKDVDGKPGKVKVMGLDLRRSDTPEFMQKFLMEILLMVLQEYPEDEILDKISEFRLNFRDMPSWEKGSPKRANNILHYAEMERKAGKANLPGHVRASINWNTLRRLNGDQYSLEITDGYKVVVCKLKNHPLKFTSVAYPVDELRLPEWFKNLPFDDELMMEGIVDKKIENLIGVLDYNLERTKQKTLVSSLFDFGDYDEDDDD